MRVLKKNLRGDVGEIALLPESLDDLWHLQHLISRGDLVFALNYSAEPQQAPAPAGADFVLGGPMVGPRDVSVWRCPP